MRFASGRDAAFDPSTEGLEEFAPLLQRLSKDMKNAAKMLTRNEARFLVDSYYQMQADRIVTNNRVRSMQNEPHILMSWLLQQNHFLEKQVAVSLDVYSDSDPVGKWMRSICGIGPVLSAGFLAHVDITKSPVAANLWTFAGLDPTVEWKKGQKRPWNPRLKTLCYKLGECFVYVQNKPSDFYGKIFAVRKRREIAKNAEGKFAEQAERALKKFNYGKETTAYKCYIEGKLPLAHLHARARRYTVKIFLSHMHYVMYVNHYGQEPELPFKNFIDPPGDLPESVSKVLDNGVYKVLNRGADWKPTIGHNPRNAPKE